MKNLFLYAALSLLSLFLNVPAAAAQGDLVLGGTMNFTTQQNLFPTVITALALPGGSYASNLDDARNRSFTFAPYIGGEWRAGRWMTALQFSYGSSKLSIEDFGLSQLPVPIDVEQKGRQLGVGFFTRYVFNPGNAFRVYFQPAINYTGERYEYLENTRSVENEKIRYVELGVGLGALYQFSPRIRATLRAGGLTYVSGNREIEEDNERSNFSAFNFNLNMASIRLGVEARF